MKLPDKALQRELEEIYSQYHNSIKIFIGQLEVLQNKFPVEILNEIRAVFSHIAKAYVCENEKVAWENVNKAKGNFLIYRMRIIRKRKRIQYLHMYQ